MASFLNQGGGKYKIITVQYNEIHKNLSPINTTLVKLIFNDRVEKMMATYNRMQPKTTKLNTVLKKKSDNG